MFTLRLCVCVCVCNAKSDVCVHRGLCKQLLFIFLFSWPANRSPSHSVSVIKATNCWCTPIIISDPTKTRYIKSEMIFSQCSCDLRYSCNRRAQMSFSADDPLQHVGESLCSSMGICFSPISSSIFIISSIDAISIC